MRKLCNALDKSGRASGLPTDLFNPFYCIEHEPLSTKLNVFLHKGVYGVLI